MSGLLNVKMKTCLPELGGKLNLETRINKIEDQGIGTCARIEISQDADNADQKMVFESS